MLDCDEAALVDRWFPLCRSEEAARRHVYHAQLLGQELAVWRDDGGTVNAWENRCCHRGVRLTIGTNAGSVLCCRYHGWRYASGTGQCVFIPAHPELSVPKNYQVRSYPCAERDGYVWTSLGAGRGAPGFSGLRGGGGFSLRSLPFNASAPRVVDGLVRWAEGGAFGERKVSVPDPLVVAVADDAVFLAQPRTETTTLLHGVLTAPPDDGARAARWRWNLLLNEFRARLEEPPFARLDRGAAVPAYRAALGDGPRYGVAG